MTLSFIVQHNEALNINTQTPPTTQKHMQVCGFPVTFYNVVLYSKHSKYFQEG